jgi:hypothetical protein
VLLAARYPDEPAGRRLADSLGAWARRDAFAAAADPVRFADSLGRALRTVVADKHLYLQYALASSSSARPAGAGSWTCTPAAPAVAMARRQGPWWSAAPARRTARLGDRRAHQLRLREGRAPRRERRHISSSTSWSPPDWARPTADGPRSSSCAMPTP